MKTKIGIWAASATETGFVVPGSNHRDNGKVLHAPSVAGMPATVAGFLATQGHGAATLKTLRVKGERTAGSAGASVVETNVASMGRSLQRSRLPQEAQKTVITSGTEVHLENVG